MNKPTNYLFAGILGLGAMLLTAPVFAQQQPGPSPKPAEEEALLENPVSSALPLDQIMMLDPSREVRVASGSVGRDQTLVSIPYAYRRTAVLTEDLIVIRTAFVSAKVQVALKAGAIGYWAGRFEHEPKTFLLLTTPLASSYTDVWCFHGVDENNAPKYVCLQTSEDYDYELVFDGAGLGSGWYLPKNLSYFKVQTIIGLKFEERPVEFKKDFRLEYRFREWDEGDVDVLLYANGELVSNRPARRLPDGSALFRSPAGEFRMTQPGKSRHEANVTLTRPTTGSISKQAEPFKMDALSAQSQVRFLKEVDERIALARKRLSAYELGQVQPLDVAMVGEDREGFFPIKWRDTVLTRKVRPTQLSVQKSSPQKRAERFGPPNAVLFSPINEFDRKLLCLNPRNELIQPIKLDLKVNHCIEDRNGDGKFEWLYKDSAYFPLPGLMTAYVATPTSLERTGVIEVETAPSQEIPAHTLDLRATGITKQVRTEDGQYLPSQYRFSLREREDPSRVLYFANSSVIRNYNVALDRNGSGELRAADGTLLMEVRNAKMNGSAEVKLHALLKPGIAPIFDRSYEINRTKKTLAAWEAIAASARAGEDIDLSLVLAEERD